MKFVILLYALLLTACVSTPAISALDVVDIACDKGEENFEVEQCAHAVNEVFNVYLREIDLITSDSTTPEKVKKALISVNERVTPIFMEVSRTNVEYVRLRDAAISDPDSQKTLVLLHGQLDQALQKARPALVDMNTEIQEAK